LTRAVLTAFGGGVAAPSANRFGHISPTTAAAVSEELGKTVDWVLDGGACSVGVESTIVDISEGNPRILRPGMITAKQIETVLRQPISTQNKAQIRVPGAMASHYAPQTPLRIISTAELPNILTTYTAPFALLIRKEIPHLPSHIHPIVMPIDPTHYAHLLYSTLRLVDKERLHEIIVEALPMDEAWDGIRDRLQRASIDQI
jgi:L-threonylcarbamoyladenylate synthase